MSSSETAQTLVDQLAEAGDWPDPQLLEAILATGSEAVEPLRALLRRETEAVTDGEGTVAASLAVDLLGSLTDPTTIPELIELFRHFDDIDVIEPARRLLNRSGAALIEPLLEIGRDRSLKAYPRCVAIRTALEAAMVDPDTRARVAESARAVLADCLSRGPANRAPGDDIEMSSSLVTDLADLADPLARELIERAFQDGMIEGYTITRKDVEEAYRRGPRESPGPPEPWLPGYRRQYEDHQAWLRREAEPKPEPLARRSPPPSSEPEPPRAPPEPQVPFRRTAAKPGRNDPCWCGSGKKYKQCHLREDQKAG